ncbi:PBDC1 protein, partial [Psophia crepitans]|nr:PBDC1 protein [Psophia crepitans]
LISSVDPKFLNLTKVDDQIYSEFRETFRDLRIDVLDPEELKSESAKEGWHGRPRWRRGAPGCGEAEPTDLLCNIYFFSPLLATRIQFFAIEIARNREGHNSAVYSSARAPAEPAS